MSQRELIIVEVPCPSEVLTDFDLKAAAEKFSAYAQDEVVDMPEILSMECSQMRTDSYVPVSPVWEVVIEDWEEKVEHDKEACITQGFNSAGEISSRN